MRPSGRRPPPSPWPAARPLPVGPGSAKAPDAVPPDAYSLRLVAARTLYDAGRIIASSPSLSSLAPGPALVVHPNDLARVGVTAVGDTVRVTSARGTVEVPVRTDTAVAPGTCFMPFAQERHGRAERSHRRDHVGHRAPGRDHTVRSVAVTVVAIADPLFSDGVDLTVVLIVIGKTIAVFVLVLLSVLLYIWFLRKVIARMQNRIGPDRAGPFGLLQTLADGIKLFFKEQSVPTTADRKIFFLAPYLSLLPAFLAFAVVPIGGVVTIAGHQTFLQLADLPVGVLWLVAMSGLGLYGVLLAGWSSGSKYPLLGSVRASAQLLSYEAAFSLAIVGVLVQANTLSTRGIVVKQGWHGIESIFNGDWYWLPAIVALVVFLIAAIAETNHPPFDLVEAEQELTGGFFTEYTGIRFAIFYLAEFMNLITMSAIAVTLFFGGPSGPGARLPRRERLVQRVGDAGVLVHVQGDHAAVLHGLGACVGAAVALRPAHGARLEVPDRGRLPLGHDLRRRRDREGPGLVDVDRPARGDRRCTRRRRHARTRRCPSTRELLEEIK